MVDENYSNFIRTRPNKGICQPDEPENRSKERKEGKKARARKKKRLATVFSFYSVDFRYSFGRGSRIEDSMSRVNGPMSRVITK